MTLGVTGLNADPVGGQELGTGDNLRGGPLRSHHPQECTPE